jgi:uncharacterized membrane protein
MVTGNTDGMLVALVLMAIGVCGLVIFLFLSLFRINKREGDESNEKS